MKKLVAEIVRDKFKKKSTDKLRAEDRNLFMSELYSFLTDQINLTVKSMVKQRKNELCNDLIQAHEDANMKKKLKVQNLVNED